MTKRWSSTVHEPLKTKRQASKDARSEARRALRRIAKGDFEEVDPRTADDDL
jgi:hypothetical protein